MAGGNPALVARQQGIIPVPPTKRERGILDRWLQDTITGQAAQGILSAMQLPGDVYAGKVSPYAFDPQTGEVGTSPEMLERSAELAGTLGTGGLATAPMRPGVGMFGGRLAKTADLDALAKAEAMEVGGDYPDDILQATGWFKGDDGKWRFEIDDSTSTFDKQALLDQRNASITSRGMQSSDLPLSSAGLNHPELIAAYPDLADIRTLAMSEKAGSGTQRGAYQPGMEGTEEFISLQHRPNEAMHSTLLHELQHAVQQREGFAMDKDGSGMGILKPGTRGWKIYERIREKMVTPLSYDDYIKQAGGGEEWPDAKKDYDEYVKSLAQMKKKGIPSQLDIEAQKSAVKEAYLTSPQEVEARNVQARMKLDKQDRRDLPPWYSLDNKGKPG